MSSNGNAETGQDAPGQTLIAAAPQAWRDPARPVEERVDDLLARLTLEEKVAQLSAAWLDSDVTDGDMAPHQREMVENPPSWEELIRDGLGQLTRPFGTAPVDPVVGARTLVRRQEEIVAASRFGIPAIAHEECLTGVMAWRATVYPAPPAWGATFDPALVERMAAQIGTVMRQMGLHQGLAPVLDVTRDPRWGRTEETIGEDPYLVGTIGTAYVRGLQSAGVIATLKHFAGYSASRAGRNFGPVSTGPREFADVILPPFEMAIRDGRAGSVMPSYCEVDGVPPTADGRLLTALLRDEWGFTGTVVSDYFAVAFLHLLHHVAEDTTVAAGLALAAGLDVELPAARCFGPALVAAVREGRIPPQLIDRAAHRVLQQKCELGLLDPDWRPTPATLADPEPAHQGNGSAGGGRDAVLDLDPPVARALARELAEGSVVLLANDDALPLRPRARLAVVGPLADSTSGMLGCYTFPSHVGSKHPSVPPGVAIPTLLAALREELPEAGIAHAAGSRVGGPADPDGAAAGPDGTADGGTAAGGTDRAAALISDAVAAARDADVCVAVLGDHAGLFGTGTSGEGSDVADLALPEPQARLLDALLDSGTPVVLVLLAGRPYALGRWASRLAAAVQAFFPGQEGGPAVAGVLSGRVCPSGRLPLSVPREAGGQPATYLASALGHRSEVSTIDPTPLYPFGHGLSYTSFAWQDVQVDGEPLSAAVPQVPTDGTLTVSLVVRNVGDRAGADVVQLYLHDPVAQVTRPVVRLTGYARVALAPDEARRVTFRVSADLAAFTGRDGHRLVEPGDLELRLSANSAEHRYTVPFRLVGPERRVGHDRRLTAEVTVS